MTIQAFPQTMGGCMAFRFFLGKWEAVWAAGPMEALARAGAAAGSLDTAEMMGLAGLAAAELAVAQPAAGLVALEEEVVWAAAVEAALVTFDRHRRERRCRHGTAPWSHAAAFRC